jgi:hypothetical protein
MTDAQTDRLTVEWQGADIEVAPLTQDQMMILPALSAKDVVPTLRTVVRILRHSVGPDLWETISDEWADPSSDVGARDILDLFTRITERSVAGAGAGKETGPVVCPVCSASMPVASLAEHIGTAHTAGA